jgi:hypothetical protein
VTNFFRQRRVRVAGENFDAAGRAHVSVVQTSVCAARDQSAITD